MTLTPEQLGLLAYVALVGLIVLGVVIALW